MSVAYTLTLQAYLSGSWTDIQTDVCAPIHFERGMDGNEITDRTAGVGTLSTQLNNAKSNSGGALGYYSIGHASCRTGWTDGVKVRLKLVYGATTQYLFYGKLADTEPLAGKYLERKVPIMVNDYMNELLVHYVDGLAVQSSKRCDQLWDTVVDNVPNAPLNTSYATGPDIFAYALHDFVDKQTPAMNAIQRINQSGLSYMFVKKNTTDGETLVGQTRHTRLVEVSVATFNETMQGLKVRRSAQKVWNTIKGTGYPVAVGASNEVLWTLRKELEIAGSTTAPQISVRYSDPTGISQKVALQPATGVTPAAGTDYVFSSVSGSASGDLNANLSVTVSWGGNTAKITYENTGAQTGYLQVGAQIRGKLYRLNDPTEIIKTNSTSILSFGDKVLPLAFPYLDNINTLNDFATEALRLSKDIFSDVEEISFIANSNSTLMGYFMLLDVGSRITLTETVTGFSSQDFFVNRISVDFEHGQIICRLQNLVPYSLVASDFGIWGTDASNSGVWGANAADSSAWTF